VSSGSRPAGRHCTAGLGGHDFALVITLKRRLGRTNTWRAGCTPGAGTVGRASVACPRSVVAQLPKHGTTAQKPAPLRVVLATKLGAYDQYELGSGISDSPERMTALAKDGAASLELEELDEVHELAVANMRKVAPVVRGEAVGDSGLYMVRAEDSLEAARMVLVSDWTEIAKKVPGDLIVAVPSRDVLVYAGTGSSGAVEALAKFAQRAYASDSYPLSDELFRWRAKGWQVFDAKGTH